ncbi:putative uroporphyrinogen-III C-methyltransferase [Leucoagaricus sp. SymC.cos]|nr:putative uroporphyrinogen-III C-methyltransferase [Leucoagaricus sp. SymC.cos]
MQDLTTLSSTTPASSTMTFQGASLLLAFRAQKQSILVVGSGLLAASRVFVALEADFEVVVLAKGGLEAACAEIRWRIERKECKFLNWDDMPCSSSSSSSNVLNEVEKLNAFLSSPSSPKFSLACITDTVLGNSHRRAFTSAESLHNTFKSHRISVNTADIPDLCDFTFTSTQRLDDITTGERSPLQIGVTTNGQGCRIASRLRRDIVAKLSKDVGRAATNLGRLRQMAKDVAETLETAEEGDLDIASDEINEDSGLSTPNRPVPIRVCGNKETTVEGVRRRMKWVAQVSEYWPISKIAAMSLEEMNEVLLGENLDSATSNDVFDQTMEGTSSHSRHALAIPKRGRILLVGSGPGHPSLLTLATHNALTNHADLVLSDKLVPDAVLNLIPKSVQIRIARKFPGNADGAQQEMMEAAVEAAKKGLTVVRVRPSAPSSLFLEFNDCLIQLKQGDPVVYGRAGEEVLYFRQHGFEPLVIPGVSSALAAPTFAGIPITQRGVAESFIVCTGVGRKGKDVKLPGYERSRTLVVLMGVARLAQVVDALVSASDAEDGGDEEKSGTLTKTKTKRRDGLAYPRNTPIAIIERASMPDQRVLTSTLGNVVEALDSLGEQRPPGMMVIGWSVLSLWGAGDVEVLDETQNVEGRDEKRVRRWLDEKGWRVLEGVDPAWDDLQ